MKFTSELRDATCQWDHTVLSATRQRWLLRLHPNRAGWYSIYRLRKDERLSWPSWLVTYRDRLPVHRWSLIPVLTGSDVAQLRWSRPTRYRYLSQTVNPTTTRQHSRRVWRSVERISFTAGLNEMMKSKKSVWRIAVPPSVTIKQTLFSSYSLH